ncbi:MAG: hypothetical protein HYZ43_12000 [Flavobacteriia bacterium]|nr:hypothetical protein [Flavobacteriia bacterium]
MKQLIVFFFLLSSIVGLSQTLDESGISICNNPKEGYYVWYGADRPEMGIPDSGIIEEGTYINDRKEGFWIKYQDDGITPKLIGEYKNNRPNGHFYKFYTNGKLKERGYFVRNQYIDTLERFFENGNLEFFAVYDSIGKEHGTIRKYNPDGSLECEYEAVQGTIPNRPPCLPPLVICNYPIKNSLYLEVGPVYIHETPLIDHHTNEPIHSTPIDGLPITKGIKWQPNGYNKVYNLANKIWQDGVFKNGKLWDGKVYVYSSEGILLMVKVYKHGVFHSDEQL